MAQAKDQLEAFARRVDTLLTGTEVRRVASTEVYHLKRFPSLHKTRDMASLGIMCVPELLFALTFSLT